MLSRLVLAGLALPPLVGCSSLIHVPGLPPVPPELFARAFTPEELAADVQHFFDLLEEVHPDPYRNVPRAEIAARRAALLAGLDRPLPRREFQPLLAELVATLGDGHTSVYLPLEEFWSAPDGGSQAFPIDVAWQAGELCVRRTAVVTPDGALGPGARVLAIGGRPAAELFRSFLAGQSGESEAHRVDYVEQLFAEQLWLAGLRAPFRTEIASALDPANRFVIDLSGMAFNAVQRGATPGGEVWRSERRANGVTVLTLDKRVWRLERRADGVAVLSLDTFARDLDVFEDFLEPIFSALARDPPSALLIDLRRNGGGDSRLGDELLEYLSDRPWRQAGRKEWKSSAPLRRHLKSLLPWWLRWLPVQYLHPLGRKLWRAEEGELVVFEEERVEPRREELRYRGPLAWLIGPRTFSSAVGLVIGAQDCGRGLLVGAETGGVVNGFGEVLPIRLPHTRLGAQISTAYYVRADGNRDARGGVQPDVAVPATPGAAGDPVVEAAVEALRAGSRAP